MDGSWISLWTRLNMHATREILRLAYRDFAHERRLSLCYILALMAVLAPLLILFGLKFGLIDTLARRLVESAANREVVAVGSRRYDEDWFKRMSARADVAFVVPNTRRIAASLSRLQNPETGSDLRAVQMIPTGPRDPLLGPDLRPPGACGAGALRQRGPRAGGRGRGTAPGADRPQPRRPGRGGDLGTGRHRGAASRGAGQGRRAGPAGASRRHRGLSRRRRGSPTRLGRLSGAPGRADLRPLPALCREHR